WKNYGITLPLEDTNGRPRNLRKVVVAVASREQDDLFRVARGGRRRASPHPVFERPPRDRRQWELRGNARRFFREFTDEAIGVDEVCDARGGTRRSLSYERGLAEDPID